MLSPLAGPPGWLSWCCQTDLTGVSPAGWDRALCPRWTFEKRTIVGKYARVEMEVRGAGPPHRAYAVVKIA